MKLLTKKIIKALPSLYSTDNVPLEEKVVICKFFTPDNHWTWLVLEGQPNDEDDGKSGDYLFFGMVHGFEKELGYFSLSELQQIRGHLGLPVERDLSVFKVPYKKLVNS